MARSRRRLGSSARDRWMWNAIGITSPGRSRSRAGMEQIPNFGDIRQLAWCVYCGGGTETRDHVPSKVLLDDPLPKNLAVVPACLSCNTGLSGDEYFACLIECVLAG